MQTFFLVNDYIYLLLHVQKEGSAGLAIVLFSFDPIYQNSNAFPLDRKELIYFISGGRKIVFTSLLVL